MITINGSFLTSIGITSTNSGAANQYDYYNGIVVNGVTCYSQRDFFENATVNSINYNSQYGFYKAIGVFHSEPIYGQKSFMENVSFDGVTAIGNYYDYFLGIGAIALGSAPTTDFTADDVTLIIGQVVTFTDTSTETPTGWAYSMGDGSAVKTSQNPTHSFAATGSYTISLTASNATGADNETKVAYITVGTEGFNPDNITGLSMWLTTTDQDTINGAGTVSSGTTVTSWTDKSTNAYVFENTSGTPEFNGATSIAFVSADSDSLVEVVTDPFGSDTAGSMYYSGYLDSSHAQNISLQISDTATNTNFMVWGTYDSSGDKLFFQDNDGGSNIHTMYSTNTIADGAYYYASLSSSGTTYSMTLNGTSETIDFATGPDDGFWIGDLSASTENMSIGSSYKLSTSFKSGGMNKLVYFNRVLTGAEHASMVAYMSDPSSIAVPISSFTNVTAIGGVTTFTDTSTETPNAWAWDFGDGNTSTLQNPTHSYSTNGSFIVEMRADNGGGYGISLTQSASNYTLNSISSADFDDTASWDLGRIPIAGDVVGITHDTYLLNGFTVGGAYPGTPTASSVHIYVHDGGTFEHAVSRDLSLPDGSTVTVVSSGETWTTSSGGGDGGILKIGWDGAVYTPRNAASTIYTGPQLWTD